VATSSRARLPDVLTAPRLHRKTPVFTDFPMTNPTASPFAPLPVRARGTLEIFDTAFKLFRRYAGVLLGWSFLSSIVNLLPGGFFGYVFTLPLLFGATSCVIAAAVRGQNVRFGQVWGFTKPRYGALLGVLILAVILFFAVMVGVMFGSMLVAVLFASATARLGTAATVLGWILGTIGGTVVGSLLLALTVCWFTLAPLVTCLEDQHRGSTSMGRAWSLMSGQWRKACAVSVILSLAVTAAAFILGGALGFLFYGGWDKFLGADTSDSAIMGLLAGYGGISALFFTAVMPIIALIVGVFYLDLRTRKEALDLEWTNYAAKPETLPGEVPAPPTGVPNNMAPGFPVPVMEVTPSALDAGAIGYAPASSTPAAQLPPVTSQPPAFSQPPASQPPAPPFARQTPPPPPFAPAAQTAPPMFIPPPSNPVQSSVPPPPPVAPVPLVVASSLGEVLPNNGADSFASFSSQVETAPAPRNAEPLPPSIPAPPPVPAQPANAGLVGPPVEVVEVRAASAPPPVPLLAPEPASPAVTSSFAPPRRIVRPEEDEDFPSSFGGGAHS